MSVVADRPAAPTAERLALAAQVAQLRAAGLIYREIAAALGISRSYASVLATDPDGAQQLARRARYQGTCDRCGATTDGSLGRASAPTRCATCMAREQHENRHWTREAVIAAIRRWNDEHGSPPRATDWQTAARPDWAPSVNAVARYGGWKNAPFASWAAAIEAAGFPRPRVGKRAGQTDWSRTLVLEQIRAHADGPLAPRLDCVGQDTVDAAKRYFGSWPAAVAAAGLIRVPAGHAARARLKRQLVESRAREPEAASTRKGTGS